MLPPSAERPVRIFCQDERRFGLLPIQRRRLTCSIALRTSMLMELSSPRPVKAFFWNDRI